MAAREVHAPVLGLNTATDEILLLLNPLPT